MDTNTPSSTRKEIIKRKTLQANTEAATLETVPDASGVTCKQHHNNHKNNNSNRKVIKRTAKATIAAHLALLLLLQAKKKKQGDFEWIPRSRPSRRRCSAWPAHQEHCQISTVCDVKSNNTTATTTTTKTTTRAATTLMTTAAKAIIAVRLLFRLLHATDDK